MKQTAWLVEWMADFKGEAVQRGKMQPMSAIYVGVYHDGTGTITVGRHTFGSSTRPMQEAFAEAMEWLMRDNSAEQNATLGLAPDGGWAETPPGWRFDKAVYYSTKYNLQEPFKCPR